LPLGAAYKYMNSGLKCIFVSHENNNYIGKNCFIADGGMGIGVNALLLGAGTTT
jgi:hypothetical protein